MPIISRKRRAQAEPEDSPPPTRRRPSPPASDASSVEEDIDVGEENSATQARTSQDQMVKKLVRLALTSEYSRRPIKREDITKKVMAPHTGRQFKQVFANANEHLRITFGMTLIELPAREKITISQKRAAQRSAGNKTSATSHQVPGENTQSQAAAIATSSSASKQYILTSTLPARYRTPAILPAAQIPTSSAEAAYSGLTTFILSLIYLSPGSSLPESRLEAILQKVNAENYVLGEKTDKGALARMQREGYIIKVRERGSDGGEDTVDFHIGPRGKAEVGERGVAGLVREVYGTDGTDADEVERRLVRSLGDVVIEKKAARVGGGEENGEGGRDRGEGAEGAEAITNPAVTAEPERRQTRRSSGRGRRRRDEDEDEEEEDDEEEAEDQEEESEDHEDD